MPIKSVVNIYNETFHVGDYVYFKPTENYLGEIEEICLNGKSSYLAVTGDWRVGIDYITKRALNEELKMKHKI